MPFSAEHRFKKAHDIHYTIKLNVPWVSEVSGISTDILQPIYDEEFKKTGRNYLAMLAVYSYCNGGRVFKQKHLSDRNTNGGTD
jgi:hypothetical protein